MRVLDLTHEPGFFAGKLLGDLGADVVKVEPPAGDPARRRGPFWGGVEDPERSLLWLAMNTSKRGITLDVARPRGRALFLDLAARADVVLESDPPGAMEARGLGWDVLAARNPRLVLCSLTPFGRRGPHAERRGSDLTVVAASGNLFCTGDPDRAPVRCSLPVSHYHGGIEAAVGVAFALLARERSGRGQHVDVALQEAMVMPNVGTAAMAKMTGFRGQRTGAAIRLGESVGREIWPCKDGFVTFALRGGPARVPGLVAMVAYMHEHGMASAELRARDWTAHNANLLTQAETDALQREFGAFFATKTMAELYEAACARNLMLAPTYTAREIARSAQLAAREFFVEVETPGGGRLRYPGAFARGSSPIGIRRPAPRLGEHTAEVLGEVGVDAAALASLRAEGIV
ncbi:MAG TPA: CoA transferase [Candidatus Binatia bacterium]|nr:CoA transferase [Candidatus Binatia bacterium]